MLLLTKERLCVTGISFEQKWNCHQMSVEHKMKLVFGVANKSRSRDARPKEWHQIGYSCRCVPNAYA